MAPTTVQIYFGHLEYTPDQNDIRYIFEQQFLRSREDLGMSLCTISSGRTFAYGQDYLYYTSISDFSVVVTFFSSGDSFIDPSIIRKGLWSPF